MLYKIVQERPYPKNVERLFQLQPPKWQIKPVGYKNYVLTDIVNK